MWPLADPALLYSTYLGGNHWEEGLAVATDAAGNTYVAGVTYSANFPTRGPSPPLLGFLDAFVAKLDPEGTLLFSRRFGGSGSEEGAGITVDAAGNIWVTGFTDSPDFPRVNPVGPPVQPGNVDAFVVKLSPDGSTILLATNLGGTGFDRGNDIAVDDRGFVSIVGSTHSPDFPIRGAALQPADPGGPDGFLLRLAPDGALSCATYLGGSAEDEAHGVSIGWFNVVRVVGTTNSPDLRLRNQTQSFLQGERDAFYYSLRECGQVFSIGTYLGGSGSDEGLAIASDHVQGVRIAGGTTSTDFPGLLSGTELRGGQDAFVARIRNDGFLQWTTYLGGSDREWAEGVAIGPTGETTVTGLTYSLDFPTVRAIQEHCAPEWVPGACLADAFVTRLDRQAGIVWSTYLGGAEGSFAYPGEEGARDVAVDPAGNAYVTGWTYSTDFPTVNAFQPDLSPVGEGENDAFITKIAVTRSQPPDCTAATASPSVIWPPNGKVVPVSILGVTDPEGDPVTLEITGITQDEPGVAFSGIGSSVALVKAERDGKGNGRVYHILFEATDPSGASCSGEVTVCVPHDRGKGGCVDSAP